MKRLLIPTLAVLLTACSQGEEEMQGAAETATSPQVTEDTAAYTVDDTTKFKFDFAMVNIPSPANSVQDLNDFGVPYSPEILHDPNLGDKYNSEHVKAINLGVYNIDMAYAMLNDKGQDVLNYMKTVLFLGDQLGLRNAVSSMVGKRAESNLNKRDSLFKLLDEIFVKSDSYLRNNSRVFTASMIFAGSWLESLYLTSQVSRLASSPEAKQKGRRMLWEQRFHLGNLISVLGDFRAMPECAALLADLKSIHQKISAAKTESDLDEPAFTDIAGSITTLRNRYTQP